MLPNSGSYDIVANMDSGLRLSVASRIFSMDLASLSGLNQKPDREVWLPSNFRLSHSPDSGTRLFPA